MKDSRFAFVRVARALTLNKGDVRTAMKFCTMHYGGTSDEATYLERALISTANITNEGDPSGEFFEALRNLGASFIESVRAYSLLGRMMDDPGVRLVEPFRNYLHSDNAVASGWAAEGGPVIVGELNFAVTQLNPLKLGTILVSTEELVRVIGGNADAILFRDMRNSIVRNLNAALTATDDGADGVRPPGLFHDAETVAYTGDIEIDIADMLLNFQGDLTTSVFIAHPQTAAWIAMLIGSDLFGALGGELAGLPIYTSPELDNAMLGLVDCAQLEVVDLGIEPSVSGQAVVYQNANAQTSPVSLWQNNCVGLRATTFVNWRLTDFKKYAIYLSGLPDAATRKAKLKTAAKKA